MNKKVVLINQDAKLRNLTLMDSGELQKEYVVATEGYMETLFFELGVVPNTYLYTVEPPEILKNTLVTCIKYNGSFVDAIDQIYLHMLSLPEVVHQNISEATELKALSKAITIPVDQNKNILHIGVLGTDELRTLVASNDFLSHLEKWNTANVGISVVFDGDCISPHGAIPVLRAYTKNGEINQVSVPQQCNDVHYRYEGHLQNSEVPLPEYLRRYNTCLTCVSFRYHEGALRCKHCECPQKSKCKFKNAECSDPKTRRW